MVTFQRASFGQTWCKLKKPSYINDENSVHTGFVQVQLPLHCRLHLHVVPVLGRTPAEALVAAAAGRLLRRRRDNGGGGGGTTAVPPGILSGQGTESESESMKGWEVGKKRE